MELVGRVVEEIVSGLHATSTTDCLQDVGRNVLDVFQARACLVYLLDQENDCLYVASAAGEKLEVESKLKVAIGKGLAGRVAGTGASRLVARKEEYLELLREVAGANDPETPITGAMAMPMVAFGELLGVIVVLRGADQPTYAEPDMRLLKPLSNIAALAVPKASAQESLAKLAEICIRFLEEKDPYTHGHSLRVMRYALSVAVEIGMPHREQEELRLCALLHDIGKVIIKDSILTKPGKLTKAEWNTIKMHPAIGSNIASNISKKLAEKILAHHERWDGRGYPRGLSGEEIPLISRIIGITDAIDAITSKRAYREKASLEVAIEEVRRNRGTQFDPVLVDALLGMYEDGRFKLIQV